MNKGSGSGREAVVAVILARGGSKGIPKKNLQTVGGRTLIERAIHSAKETLLINDIYVSTDDLEISSEASRCGAIVIERPSEIASDESTSEISLLHAINQIEFARKDLDDLIIVFLQCTSPFINPQDIQRGIVSVKAGTCDVAFSVVEHHGFIWKVEHGNFTGVNHDFKIRSRRQDLNKEYLETGAFYIFRAREFKKQAHRFFGIIKGIEVNPAFSLEIDSYSDLNLAKQIAQTLPNKNFSNFDIKVLVTDFDGVHTNDQVIIDQLGNEAVIVSRKDGLGIDLLKTKTNIKVLILSRESNPVVSKRAAKLNVEVLQNVNDKASTLEKWCQNNDFDLKNVAYLGNDLNDLEVMKSVGLPLAVENSPQEILQVAQKIISGNPGVNSVRNACNFLIDLYSSEKNG